MPLINEHACRLKSPDQYDRFRRGEREHEGKKYGIIFGHPKDGGGWEEQAYRYPTAAWSVSEARSHCKSHDGIGFEPASGKQQIAWTAARLILAKELGVPLHEVDDLVLAPCAECGDEFEERGLTLAADTGHGLAAVAGVNQRFRALGSEKAGQPQLSQPRRERYRAWLDRLAELLADGESFYEETAPKPKADDDDEKTVDAIGLLLQYQSIQARYLMGVST